MGLPKKGTRTISVDKPTYQWVVSHRFSTYCYVYIQWCFINVLSSVKFLSFVGEIIAYRL